MEETTKSALCGSKTKDGKQCSRALKPDETTCWQHAWGLRQHWKAITPRVRSLIQVVSLVGSLITIGLAVPQIMTLWKTRHSQPLAVQGPETAPPAQSAPNYRGPNIGIVGGHGKNSFDHVRAEGADIGIIAPGKENKFKNTEVVAPKRIPPVSYGIRQ
jgi:hypothetical protein